VQRRRAKRRQAEQNSGYRNGESAQLARLKEYQDQLLANAKNLPEDELKRLKQVVRNPISAQQSRDKKKCYIQDIERSNKDLKVANHTLKSEIERVRNENRLLKAQIRRLADHKTPFFSSKARTATVAIASILSVMMVVGSVVA
jgi:hypothetical protein